MKAILVILLAFSLIPFCAGYNLPASSVHGELDMTSHKITSLAAPSADTDAATKAYADSVAIGGCLPTTGGIMTGQIDFCGFTAYNSTVPVNDTDLSTKLYADYRASWVNVKEYGAKGDNSTDDTAAFNAAIAVANSAALSVYYMYSKNTNTLYIPDGEYNITPGALSEIRCNVYGPGGPGTNWLTITKIG